MNSLYVNEDRRVVCFQSEKDVASWLRSGVVGQPSYDATTKEIIAQKKQTSDVTSQVNVKTNNNKWRKCVAFEK